MEMKSLYGIYGEHTQQSCPLYNKEVREYILSQAPDMEKNCTKIWSESLTSISLWT
jgi:hypothetical protein